MDGMVWVEERYNGSSSPDVRRSWRHHPVWWIAGLSWTSLNAAREASTLRLHSINATWEKLCANGERIIGYRIRMWTLWSICIYGRVVTVESDHKPLEQIAKKPFHDVPKRLQSMFLQFQKYDLNITYKKGSQLFIADTLSRAHLEKEETRREDHEFCAHAV